MTTNNTTASEMKAIADAIRAGLNQADPADWANDGPDECLEWSHPAFAEARRLTRAAEMEWDFTGWQDTLDAVERVSR